MKAIKSLVFLMCALVALTFTGCDKPEDLGDPAISIDKKELNFSQAKASETITVTSTRDWKVKMSEEAAEWIIVEPAEGTASSKPVTVTLTVKDNAGANRSATVEFFAGLVSDLATVNQEGPLGDASVVEDLTVAEFIAKADTKKAYRLTGTVKGFNPEYCSFNLKDESGQIYVYSVTDETKEEWTDKISNNGTVVITGVYKYYADKSQHEVVSAKIESFTEGEAGGPDASGAIYYNNFDTEAAVQKSDKWPFLDQTECWKNQQGTGASAVTYAFTAMSARNNSNSDGSYSDYDGSGTNNLFFGASSYFAVGNIALGSARNIAVSFGTEEYDNKRPTIVYEMDKFHVYVSTDGDKWVELSYEFVNEPTVARWDIVSTKFSVPEGTESICLAFQADVASVFRMDDLLVVADTEQADLIDFSAGKSTDFSGELSGNVEVPVVTANRADLESLNKGQEQSAYGTYKTESGWKLENGCVQKGGDSDKNPVFAFIGKTGDTWNMAACINGKTTAVGVLTSPEITGGVGTITFNFGHAFNELVEGDDTKGGCKVQIDVIKDGQVAKTVTLEKAASEIEIKTAYEAEFELNVAGPCSLKFTNLCPSGKSDGNKDRVALWNISWTDFE